MSYKTIKTFVERFDGKHKYEVGDIYPRGDGYTPPEGRAEALASGEKGPMNSTGEVFLIAMDPPSEQDEQQAAAEQQSLEQQSLEQQNLEQQNLEQQAAATPPPPKEPAKPKAKASAKASAKAKA